MSLLKKIVYKVFNIVERAALFPIEHAAIFLVVKTRYKRLPSSVLGYCNALAGDQFYKIAVGNSFFLLEEKKNIDLIQNKYPKIKKMSLDYQHMVFLNKSISVMRTQRRPLISGRPEKFEAARKVLNTFREYGVLRACSTGELPYLSGGLALVERFYGAGIHQGVRASVQQFFKGRLFRLGPCHGDLHHKNIVGTGENPYVVDLDCFRDDGLQALDALYYVNQYIADDEKIPWHAALVRLLADKKKYSVYYDFLHDFLDMKAIKGYALIYCLDRFKQDAKYLKDWGIFMGNRFRQSILCLMDQYEVNI